MAQGTQQFSPAQILEAGRRAEIEGRVEYAIQFYRHLTEHMPRTPEALVAEQALLRLTAQPAPDPSAAVGTMNGHYQGATSLPGGSGSHMAASYGAPPSSRALVSARSTGAAPPESEEPARRKFVMPRLRRRYRTGRFVARAFTVLGFVEILTGAGLVGAGMLAKGPPLPEFLAAQQQLVGVSLGLTVFILGLVQVLGGQLARAMFDTASANRDLASYARARALHESGAAEEGAPQN